LFVKDSAIYMLVEFNILLDVPDLLNMLKIPTEFPPPSIAFFEGKRGPQLFVEQLIDRCVTIDSSTWIAVLERSEFQVHRKRDRSLTQYQIPPLAEPFS
jgi:hypothetical protein